MHPVERFRRLAYRALGISEIVEFTKEMDWFVSRDVIRALRTGQGSVIQRPILQLDGPANIIIGDHTTIGRFAWLSAYESYGDQRFSPRINIGNRVYVGDFACITSTCGITIGNGSLISQYVYISDHVHGLHASSGLPIDQALENKGPIVIGEGCFVGFRVSILPGASLGERCVVGAHSVVNRSFPPFSMLAGQPARVIKRFCFDTRAWIPSTDPD